MQSTQIAPLPPGSTAPPGTARARAARPANMGKKLFIARSIRIFRVEQADGRHDQDVEVEQYRPVLDIIEVVVDPLHDLVDGVGLAAPAVDLRPAGDAGLDAVAGEIALHGLVIEQIVGL